MTNTRLIEERKHRQWSQQEVADRLGTTQHNVSRWERGETTPGPYFRTKLCALFGKSAQELGFFPDSHQSPAPVETETPASVETLFIEEPFQRIDEQILSTSPSPAQNASESSLRVSREPTSDRPQISFEEALLLPLKTFVGRVQEVRWLQMRLRSGGIIALCGMGGIGKTALASEVIRRMREEGAFRDGVVVELCQDQQNSSEIVRRILARFEPSRRFPQASSQTELIAAAHQLLDGKEVLVVLENIESERGLQIKEVMAPLLAASSILLLTREIPPHEVVPVESCYQLGFLSQEHALDLFALSLGREGVCNLTPQETAAAHHIITFLGRHTLAIKLAGAYAADCALDLRKLAMALRQPQWAIDLRDSISAPTLATILERSTEALPPETKRLFAALTVFSSTGFGRQAAIALGKALCLTRPWEQVDLLVRRALLEAWVNSHLPEMDDCERLCFHPLIYMLADRKFAAWSSEEQENMYHTVATYYVTYGREASQDGLVLDELTILNMLQWAHRQRQDELVVGLCFALQYFWRAQWRIEPCLTYLPWGITAAEAIIQRTTNPQIALHLKALGLIYGYILLLHTDKLDEAQQVYHMVLTVPSEGKREASEGTAFFFLGYISLLLNQLEKAEYYFEASLAIRCESQDEREWPLDYLSLSRVAQHSTHLKILERYYREALSRDRHGNNRWGEMINFYSLGWVSGFVGNVEEEELFFLETLRLLTDPQQERGDPFVIQIGCGVVYGELGKIALLRQQLDEAEIYLNKSIQLLQGRRNQREESWVRCYVGRLALARENRAQAKEHFYAVLEVARKEHDLLAASEALYYLAIMTKQEGKLAEAERLQRESLRRSRERHISPGIVQSCLWLGYFLIEHRKNWEEGCSLLQETIHRLREIGCPYEANKVQDWLSLQDAQRDDKKPSGSNSI